MSIRPLPVRVLPLTLVVAVMAASACGPIKIDVAPLPTPKPSAPGSDMPASPGASPTAKPSPTPVGSSRPGATPTPAGTTDPNATPTPVGSVDPNATPTPGDAGASLPPGASPTPPGTPKPWPSAAELPGGTPVQGEVYAITRDAGKPTDVAVDAGGVAWIGVGQFNVSGDPPKGELVRMDAEGTPLQVLTLEGNPKRVEAAAGGGVWVLMDVKSTSGGMTNLAIVRLSKDAKVLSRLDLGYGGGSSGNEGLRIVPEANGNVWVRGGQSWSSNSVYKIAAGGGLLGTYSPPSGSYSYGGGLGVDQDGSGWLADGQNNKVLKLKANLTKDAEFDTTTPDNPYGAYELASTGDRVWVVLQKEIAVWKLDGTRDFGAPTGFPIMQMRPAGDGGMWALSLSGGGMSSHSGSVIRFDAKGVATASFAMGPDVRGFGVGGDGAIWAANYEAGTVTRVGTR